MTTAAHPAPTTPPMPPLDMLVPLKDLAGPNITLGAIMKWSRDGVSFRGQRIRLPIWYIGKKRHSTREALAQFLADCNRLGRRPEHAA